MFLAAAGLYNFDEDDYRPSRKRSVSPARVTRTSSDKIVGEITSMFSAFEPEKAWAKASASFVGLTTDEGRTIDDFRNSFFKQQYCMMLEKVLALAPEEIKDNILISTIIKELTERSGKTSGI